MSDRSLEEVQRFATAMRELGAHTVAVGDVRIEFAGAYMLTRVGPEPTEADAELAKPVRELTEDELTFMSAEAD